MARRSLQERAGGWVLLGLYARAMGGAPCDIGARNRGSRNRPPVNRLPVYMAPPYTVLFRVSFQSLAPVGAFFFRASLGRFSGSDFWVRFGVCFPGSRFFGLAFSRTENLRPFAFSQVRFLVWFLRRDLFQGPRAGLGQEQLLGRLHQVQAGLGVWVCRPERIEGSHEQRFAQ